MLGSLALRWRQVRRGPQNAPEGEELLSRLLNTITNLGGASDLDSYLINIHRTNGSTAPTRDEANKDYAATMRASATPWGRF